jgi:hypothetical protein
MPFRELETEIEITLKSLRVKFNKVNLFKDSAQFISEDFGVIISALDRVDYSYVSKEITKTHSGYRHVYVAMQDNLIEKREEIVWALMEGGYMRYVRQNYNRQFTSLIVGGFGDKIIRERLRRYGDKPMYKFLIENDKQAKNLSVSMILSEDPSYFDYMPKEY